MQNSIAILIFTFNRDRGSIVVKASACNGGTESSNRLYVSIGSFALNAVSNANVSTAKITSLLKAFPNPAQNKATVVFAAKGTYTIQLTDATGKLMKTIKGNAVAAENKVDIDLSRLSKGVYFVTLIAENKKKEVVTLSKQ